MRDDFVQVYERDLPAAVRCFLDDFEACIAHLRFPLRHRKVIRTTDESVKGGAQPDPVEIHSWQGHG